MNSGIVMTAGLLLAVGVAAAGELEGWWRFHERGGDESTDGSGKNRTVLVDTNRVWRAEGAPGGGALWFDGVTNVTTAVDDYAYALVPAFEELSLADAFSVAAWIRPEVLSPFAPIIVRTGDTEDWNDGFALYVAENGALGAYVRAGDDTNAVTGGSLSTNVWNHVAMTYSGTELKLYLNGHEVSSRVFSESASSDAGAPLGIGTIVGSCRVQPFAGAIADVRVWSSALPSSRMNGVYHEFLGEAVDPDGDLDGDGMPNGWEARFGLDPSDSSDAEIDTDGDGVTNLREYRLGRSPRADARTVSPSLVRSATAATL